MKVFVIVRTYEDHYPFTDVLGVAINEEKAKKGVSELNADREGFVEFTYCEFDSNALKKVTAKD